MRKSLILFVSFLLLTGSFANVNSLAPGKKASEIFLPVGKSGQKISLQELSVISMKDLQNLTGKKMSFTEKMSFKAGQRQLRKNIHSDGTLDKGFVNKLQKAGDPTSGFHLGGFALGFLLFLIGVLIAYLINDDKKSSRVKWAWIGAAISLVLWIVISAL
jgi:hypothetical protein